jgi:hypothetical protein
MRKIVAAFLMLVLFAAHTSAQTASASALAAPGDIPAASAISGDAAAMPVHKRVCWRKMLTGVRGNAGPLAAPPCGVDVKNTCDARLLLFPARRQAYAPAHVLDPAGNDGGGPFRPPIA